jgi:ribonuclease HI
LIPGDACTILRRNMSELVAYTDGGCRGNPGGLGGWGFVLIDPRTSRALERAGGAATTTNNRMEMQAAIEALSAVRRGPRAIVVRTDSLYLLKSCSVWLPGWKARGWRRKDGPLLNVDLLQRLDELQSRHRVRWEWVRGHAGERGNEHADRLANQAMDRIARGDELLHERRFRWTATR